MDRIGMNGLLNNNFIENKGLLYGKNPSILGNVFGIPERIPFESEIEFFRKNPEVAGMAAEDNAIVMNPFSTLKENELQAVKMNEAARIYMKDMPLNFSLTKEQEKTLNSLPFYKNADEDSRKSTIIARMLSGDPTSGSPTEEQLTFMQKLKNIMGIE